MLESIRRKVKAEFISAGCTQEEIDFFFAAGSDPLKVAFAIAAMQIGREERERVAERFAPTPASIHPARNCHVDPGCWQPFSGRLA